MDRITIASLKFSPGHYSLIKGFLGLFTQKGYRVTLILDSRYKAFVQHDNECNDVVYYGHAQDEYPKHVFAHVIVNMSTRDNRYINSLKKESPELKVLFMYHEPFRGYAETISKMISGDRNLKHSAIIIARHLFSKTLLKKSSIVMLPSENAKKEYEKNDIVYNEVYEVFPLVYVDERTEHHASLKKEYFSFIATAIKSKGFPEYLAFIKWVANKDKTMKFQIITKTDISEQIDEQIQALVSAGRLIIKQGQSHTDETMHEAYARSCCTWFGYNSLTQSGVLCKSFMLGSPGIATELGGFEEYITGENSLFISSNKDCEEIYSAYKEIQKRLPAFEVSARETFLSRFLYSNMLDKTEEILKYL